MNIHLPATLKNALVVTLDDRSLQKLGSYWTGSSGRRFATATIEALFDRCLMCIGVESRHRNRYTAKLTDAGQHAARAIRDEIASAVAAETGRPRPISEEVSKFIAQAVS